MIFAKIVTEVAAPWVTNILLFLILGISLGAPAPGLLAAFMTGILPMVAVLRMIRQGRVASHHVTVRTQRGALFAIILGLLAVLIVGLLLLDTPREIWLAGLAAVLFILAFSVINQLGLKISIHVGLWVPVWSYLGLVLSPWWSLALLVTPLIAWSRLKLTHHSWAEIIGGAFTGLAVVAVMLPLL
ncbi:phosphoesterase [Corynebacterium hylobatis]|uniref:Phosphoesterase n=1 Tax=Corynebacterium hylobatis TaxID=1859290 RepID=A0A3R9ZCM7_9CORY|nr:phosphoesterase [Corynebacterium hylobatis]RSZ61792.1 phosphoesterase [Corynebacterium hylobatis]